jgi:hypothetical protein
MTTMDLQEAIAALEQEKAVSRYKIEDDIRCIHESLGASNILKAAFHSVAGKEGIKSRAANTALSLGSGWVAQKLFTNNSTNIFRRLLGTVVQVAVTGLMAKKSGNLASKSIELGNKLLSKRSSAHRPS